MKVLLMQHGEKLVLLIVLIILGMWISGVNSDGKTLPKKQAEKINIDKKIKEAKDYTAKPAPIPEKPMDYTGVIQNRLAVLVDFADTLQWLTAHPDIVEGSTDDRTVFSIYEVLSPSVTAEDEVGSILVTVEMPDRRGGKGGDEVQTGDEIEWERALKGGKTVTNTARWLGVKVEYQVGGKGAWRPLKSVGLKDGVHIFRDESMTPPEFRHNGVQGKQQYSYRASLIVAATGVREEGPAELGEETIVYDGEYTGQIDRFVWAQGAGRIKGRLKAVEPKTVPDMHRVTLGKTEKLYIGRAGEAGTVEQTESDIIFAVKQISALGGTDPTLRVYMMKMVRDRNGKILGWTEALEIKNVKVGDKLGTPPEGQKGIPVKLRNAPDGGLRLVNFQTDWVVADLNIEGRRIYYYEVKKKNVDGKTILYLNEKARTNYHVVTLNNGVENIQIIRLDKLTPNRNPQFCYPLIQQKVNETEEFKDGDPTEFTQPILEPEKPVEWPADKIPPDGVPEDFQTDVPYFVFADGRIVWYDHVNKKMKSTEVKPPKVEEPEVPEGGEGEDGEAPPDGQEPPPDGN